MCAYGPNNVVEPETPDGLQAFRESLAAIEQLAVNGESIEGLLRHLRIVHCNFCVNIPSFKAGTDVCRAVRVSERPNNKSRISYPPLDRVGLNGRLNAAGESLFYGSLGTAGVSLYECRAEPGELFALGFWKLNQTLIFNQLGYSSMDILGTDPNRIVQSWMTPDPAETKNGILQNWQARVFTRHIADGEEHLYTLSIALARFAMGPVAPTGLKPDCPRELAGVIYPSIATKISGDNVAIRTSVVDSSLVLNHVSFVRINAVQPVQLALGEHAGRINVQELDRCVQIRSDGKLIWNSDPTWLTVSPWL